LANAQERLSREEALKLAFLVSADLTQLQSTPIPTDPDVKRPVVVHDEDYGGMVLPETKLSLNVLGKANATVTPIGQLWLHKLAPLCDGQVTPEAKLRMVSVNRDEGPVKVPLCALGVTRNPSGNLELLVFGKDSEPLLRVPLRAISTTQENPLEIGAERKSDGGLITLKILGRYEAEFMVTDPERY
jgi:hypothetical protein